MTVRPRVRRGSLVFALAIGVGVASGSGAFSVASSRLLNTATRSPMIWAKVRA